VIAALQLDRRVQRAMGAVAYLAVNVPIAILAVFAVLGVMLGAALSVIRAGLPLVLGAAAACRWLLRADRRAANRFLGMQIPPLPVAPRTSGTSWRRSLAVLSDRMLLRNVAILAAKPVLIALLVVVGLVPIVLLA
jgi:Putative sensor